MDATELSRWTRFAAKGGIGKSTATRDREAESPKDLMFLKEETIIVLMQLPEETRDGECTSGGVGSGENGWYLGYCEGVVGRFQGKHVHFHSKLKRPVMTKRSSTASARSPSPRNSNVHGDAGGNRATTPIQTASPQISMSTSTSTPPPFSASNSQSCPGDRDGLPHGARSARGGTTSFRVLSLPRSLSRVIRVRIPPSFRSRIVDNLRPRTHPPKSEVQSFYSIEYVASSGSIAVGPHQDRVLVIGSHINAITININPTIYGDCLSGPISNAIVGGRNNANNTSMPASEEPKL